MSAVEKLLRGNTAWARATNEADPNFLPGLAEKQQPQVLWIGCADSRVPETTITGSRPGDIFVHRNIANQFQPKDINALSVLEYAIDFLHVKHVVLVGHSNCGGAAACLAAAIRESNADGPTTESIPKDAPLDLWLAPLTKLARSLGPVDMSRDGALNLLIETNVKHQVDQICKSKTIVEAWRKEKDVTVYGWVYDLATGIIQDLGISRSRETWPGLPG
ncbi:hypothetical protein NP233_g2101 [Leucocoprinus birnbaumii]|uniref:Carbonic anhydrase n=1 Tax=Leucocoprinus birnbaumii TaxID=56174 RepID=A0AAD5W2V6_9AGAR|nr:hypothetical protein NP233_g2101 [Leucocoprinus birnbaumii]